MEGQQALNQAGAAPTPAQFIEYGDGLVSTTEFSTPAAPAKSTDTPAEGAAKTEGQKAGEKAATGQEPARTEGVEDKGGRLDRDARFQQVIKSNKDLKAQVADLTSKLEQLVKSGGIPQQPKPDADGKIFGMTPDELLDLQATKPAEYHKLIMDNIAKQVETAVTESYKKTADQRTHEEGIAKTYEAYAKDNPEFDQMWDAGEIQDYMAKNPGHNAISAHMALTMEKRINAAVEKAQKETLDKVRTDLRTKGKNAVLGDGPVSRLSAADADQDLKDPKKFGGTYAVLARRSAARRAGA